MPDLQQRKVKIVCTLGPSSQTEEQLTHLIEAGMDVARLNFSHGTHDSHRTVIERLRQCSKNLKREVSILLDLQGPKLRVGRLLDTGLPLKTGDICVLYPEDQPIEHPLTEAHHLIPLHAEIGRAVVQDVSMGSPILFDDGKIFTEVTEVHKGWVACQVKSNGTLYKNKGINLPGTPLSVAALTEKDRKDVEFGVSMGVDAFALSFVRRAQDIIDLQDQLRSLNVQDPPMIFAKIEREEAIENMNSIVAIASGCLVARGDMAVEIGAERVPIVQKQLIRACNEVGIPVITATQMLESMIQNMSPTRAEASDVANAVFDGTDAVMLSGETANGQFPVITVQTMAKIILGAEAELHAYSVHPRLIPKAGSVVESLADAAARMAHSLRARLLVSVTRSGVAARTVSQFRPEAPIVAIVETASLARRLQFSWGVVPLCVPKLLPTDDLLALIEKAVLGAGLAKVGDLILITAGIPTLQRGTTNTLKVHRLGHSTIK